MIVIRNNIIPFGGYKCINICGILFAKKNAILDEETLNHEAIHSAQIFEMLVVFFYLWYVIEFIIRFLSSFKWKESYKKIGFEQESNYNESDLEYLDSRNHYAWFYYI